MRKEFLMGEESGQGMMEYGLVLTLISIAAIVAMRAIGNNVIDMFKNTSNKFKP